MVGGTGGAVVGKLAGGISGVAAGSLATPRVPYKPTLPTEPALEI